MLRRLHRRLEKFLVQKISEMVRNRQLIKKGEYPDPTKTLRFKIANRVEYRLRKYLYPRKK